RSYGWSRTRTVPASPLTSRTRPSGSAGSDTASPTDPVRAQDRAAFISCLLRASSLRGSWARLVGGYDSDASDPRRQRQCPNQPDVYRCHLASASTRRSRLPRDPFRCLSIQGRRWCRMGEGKPGSGGRQSVEYMLILSEDPGLVATEEQRKAAVQRVGEFA